MSTQYLYPMIILGIVVLFSMYLLLITYGRQKRIVRQLSEKLLSTEQNNQIIKQNLEAVFQVSQKFVDSSNENDIIEFVLKLTMQTTSALGASFVPLSDRGQPLGVFVHGELPLQTPEAWLEYLASPAIRQSCGQCNLYGELTTTCPLLHGPFNDARGIYCLPVRRGEREIGILNLYLPDHHQLTSDAQAFLKSLLEASALALDSLHLRERELETLGRLRGIRQTTELRSTVHELLLSIIETLDADFGILVLESGAENYTERDGWIENQYEVGEIPEAIRSNIHTLVHQNNQIETSMIFPPEPTYSGNNGHLEIFVSPLRNTDKQQLGVMILGKRGSITFQQRHLQLIQIVSKQFIHAIQVADQLAEFEYRVMMEERVRLAREIHDGLAQTLGFLKLQVAQMISYLERNDRDRLSRGLRESYEALSEAYRDAREAIDGLRINGGCEDEPWMRLKSWIEQSICEYQDNSDIAGMDIRLKSYNLSTHLPPEVQAQLMRIIQEALSNIRKHANATAAWISVDEYNDELVVKVSDNGRGFQVKDVPTTSKHGLRGMQERAGVIGADFQIISQPEAGTTVFVRLPLGKSSEWRIDHEANPSLGR